MSSINEIQNILNAIPGLRIRPAIAKVTAIEYVKSVHMNFESGGRPAWQPRKRISKKQRGTNILVISGAMKNVTAYGDTTTSGVIIHIFIDPRARDYWQIHETGGIINIPAHTVRHRVVKTGKLAGRTVFASSRHKATKETMTKAYTIPIPRREYLNVPPEDRGRWMESIKQAIHL